MLGIHCVGVCVGASQRISLSVLVRNPHKRPALVSSHETERKVPEHSTQKRTVGMREQSREGHSQ